MLSAFDIKTCELFLQSARKSKTEKKNRGDTQNETKRKNGDRQRKKNRLRSNRFRIALGYDISFPSPALKLDGSELFESVEIEYQNVVYEFMQLNTVKKVVRIGAKAAIFQYRNSNGVFSLVCCLPCGEGQARAELLGEVPEEQVSTVCLVAFPCDRRGK